MIIDQEGNPLTEGDWFACTCPGMIKGQILAAVDGAISAPGQATGTAFITVAIQIPCVQNTRVVGGSKIAGPPQPKIGE